jgi:hypothetical protein
MASYKVRKVTFLKVRFLQQYSVVTYSKTFLSLWGASCCVIYVYYMNI